MQPAAITPQHNPLRSPKDYRLNRIAGPSSLIIFGVTGDLSRKKLMRELNREKYGSEDQREAHLVHVGPSCLRECRGCYRIFAVERECRKARTPNAIIHADNAGCDRRGKVQPMSSVGLYEE